MGRSCHQHLVLDSVLLKIASEQWSEVEAKHVEPGTNKCAPLYWGERTMVVHAVAIHFER